MNANLELRLLRLLRRMSVELEHVTDLDKLLRYALREAKAFFRADDACIVSRPLSPEGPELRIVLPERSDWDTSVVSAFLQDKSTHVPHNVTLGRLRWRGRSWWAVLGLHRRQGEFEWDELKALEQICAHVNLHLAQLEQRRALEVRSRLDRKIMEQLRPRDLFYQLLDGLRIVTDYDHSSALLTAEAGELELVAEQIAWRKGRSQRIGLKLPLSDALRNAMGDGGVFVFDRDGDGWRPSDGESADAATLADLLDFDRASDVAGSPPRPAALLCAPLATRTGVIGVLRVAGMRPRRFGAHEREVVGLFISQASVAIQYLQGTQSLHDMIVDAEKRNAVANLARGVSHDVNNALGGVLPLVQQVLEDIDSSQVDPAMLRSDLRRIEESLQVCRRIFSGMLGFARSARQTLGQGNIRRAIDSTLAVLRSGVERQGIAVDIAVEDNLPLVRTGQGNLEQLILNLATNARDAMPSGGRLSLRATPLGDMLEVVIADTGCGIAPEIIARVEEPFFTTKSDGHGLGLSICRSLVWEMRGDLTIKSELGNGTHVRLLLPVADARPIEAAT